MAEFIGEMQTDLTASQTFANESSEIVNHKQVAEILDMQSEIYRRLKRSQESLSAFNDFSATLYKNLQKDFERHTRMVHDMQTDLSYVFRKIRVLKAKMEEKTGQLLREGSSQREVSQKDVHDHQINTDEQTDQEVEVREEEEQKERRAEEQRQPTPTNDDDAASKNGEKSEAELLQNSRGGEERSEDKRETCADEESGLEVTNHHLVVLQEKDEKKAEKEQQQQQQRFTSGGQQSATKEEEEVAQ